MINTETAMRPLHVVLQKSDAENSAGSQKACDTRAQGGVINAYGDIEERVQVLSRWVVAVQEEEKRSIACELHDEVGQYLSLAVIMADQAAKSQPEQIALLLNEVKMQLMDVIQKVRNLSLDLRPSILDDPGLIPALNCLFDCMDTQSGLKIDFKHNNIPDHFSPEIDITVYQVVQAALTNIVRHAGVANARVRLIQNRRQISLTVEDKGIGFNTETVSFGLSTGISTMCERVRILGGKFEIKSSPWAGTRVTAEIPLPCPAVLANVDGR
jgi:signal transduction histidine kinase